MGYNYVRITGHVSYSVIPVTRRSSAFASGSGRLELAQPIQRVYFIYFISSLKAQ